MPDLSIIIASHNTADVLVRCLTMVEQAARVSSLNVEVLVVDNASTDDSADRVAARFPGVRLIRNATNRGFAGANNLGLARARAPIALLLNSDAFISPQLLHQGIDLLRTAPEIGLAGVRIVNPDGALQAAYGTFPTLWSDITVSLGLDQLHRSHQSEAGHIGPVDWVHGACMFVRVGALADVGPLDESFFMYSEEVDWCRRFWTSGWEVWYLGNAMVTHLGGTSSTSDLRRRVALYRGRLGLRRRFDGPLASGVLWVVILLGLGLRSIGRGLVQHLLRRRLGRQSPQSDWLLAREIARLDPLARWALL